MKTLVVANQKGGVGKTSSLVHLAFDALERGLRVVVIDLDTQANASYTLGAFDRQCPASHLFTNAGVAESLADDVEPGITLLASDNLLANVEKMPLAAMHDHFAASIDTLASRGFDLCLIDTAPSLGNALATALLCADYVLSPIELEAYSIQGIKKMLTTIANVKRDNASLRFLGMVPSKVDRRNPRHVRHLDELQAAYPALVLPLSIGLRSSIADALASCVPVWKIRKTAARTATKEIRALAAHVFDEMEIA